MNTLYVQALRHKLQKRVRRLNSIVDDLFFDQLGHFFAFLDGQPMLAGLLADLDARYPQAGDVGALLAGLQAGLMASSEAEHAAIGHHLLRYLHSSNDPNVVLNLGFKVVSGGRMPDYYRVVRQLYLDALYEYLDEHLDDQRLMLELLRRYKHRCEWFHRQRLHDLWAEDTQNGEKRIGMDLYEYLHEQGVEFHIEPWGESGEIDLIAMQGTRDPLLCDVKLFNPEKKKGKPYIRAAFHQIHTYMNTYNEAVGYLVIFNTGGRPLAFDVGGTGGVPWVAFNGKVFYLVVVDLYPHEKTASKRGPLEPVVVTEAELTGAALTEANA